MDSTLRFLAPIEHDRIVELLQRYPCSLPKNIITHLQLLKILKITLRYLDVLDKIELIILKQHEFNFILRNLPEFAQLSANGKHTKVGYEEITDTLEQFGDIAKIVIIKGTVYVEFINSAEYCHQTINNMQIGKNIISTKNICM